MMQIGDVAARVGLSLRTIRHYDQMGLIVPSERSAGGFRLYTETDIERLELIKTMRPLDIPLEQVRELLAVIDALATGDVADGGSDPERATQMRYLLGAFRSVVDGRIGGLRAQVTELEVLSRRLGALTTRTAASAAVGTRSGRRRAGSVGAS